MKSKHLQNLTRLVLEGILGGLLISIGVMVLQNAPNKTVGAILFAVGLLSINKFGLGLYTGKVGMIRNGSHLLQTLIVLLANFVGCLVMFAFPVDSAVESLQSKMNFSHLEILFKGIVCGVLIFVSVANKQQPLYTIFAVPAFILCGAEHSIADIALVIASRQFSWDTLVFVVIVVIGNAIGGLGFSLLLDLIKKLKQQTTQQKDNQVEKLD